MGDLNELYLRDQSSYHPFRIFVYEYRHTIHDRVFVHVDNAPVPSI